MQSSNGQTSPQPEPSKPKRHNAKHCSFADRQRIINGLANGDSKRPIALRLHISRNTVVAVHETESNQVEQLKQRRINQWERVADTALDNLNDQLQAKGHELAPNVLAPIAGIATDKLALLRGGDSLHIRHEHFHRITDDDLLAFAIARSKQIQATVIEPEPETEPEHNLNSVLALKESNNEPVTSRTGKRVKSKKPVS